MIYTLENDIAKVKVDTHACEITSFQRKDTDIEYMWNGDPTYWAGRNPLLFPHVSSPYNLILNFKGKDYPVNNHGFARNSDFTLVEETDTTLLFQLTDNEETYQHYPYHFELLVKYTLQDAKLNIDYEVVNQEDGKLYFGFGQHPAFNCPLDPSKDFSDYYIEFEKEDIPNKRLNLSYELFDEYPTYIINNPKSKTFTLTDGNHKVIMRIDDKYKIFAVWTPHAPFVCLEPWVNLIDREDNMTPFEERDVICLEKDEHYLIGYSIEIN